MAGLVACAGSDRVRIFHRASALARLAYPGPFSDESLTDLLERKRKDRMATSWSGQKCRLLARVFRQRPRSVIWPVDESPPPDDCLRQARDMIEGRATHARAGKLALVAWLVEVPHAS
jgi:hypothetical protein